MYLGDESGSSSANSSISEYVSSLAGLISCDFVSIMSAPYQYVHSQGCSCCKYKFSLEGSLLEKCLGGTFAASPWSLARKCRALILTDSVSLGVYSVGSRYIAPSWTRLSTLGRAVRELTRKVGINFHQIQLLHRTNR